jgi:hypothetical protein
MIRSWPQMFPMAEIKCQTGGTVHHNSQFHVDATDQEDYTLVEQTDDTIYIRARFTKKGY